MIYIYLGIANILAMQALNTAATGMKAQEENVNVISNNIANTNTVGFKKGRANFNDLYYQTLEEAGSSTGDSTVKNTGIQIGMGVKVNAVSREFSQGSPNITKNPFDLMISGEGFFGILVN